MTGTATTPEATNGARFRITGELGRGAMGVVYRAEDAVMGRTVALKTMPMGAASAEAQRLRREAKVAGALSHPGIVTIFDVVEQDGALYICMEYVDGPTLEALLAAKRALSPATILDILRQTAAALDYAHQKGVIHRDVKPGNIMLHDDRQVKIADFGIAKMLVDETTLAGQPLGTPSYMPPEQIQSRPVGGRADQFSLAVIAYELITGQKPFPGYSMASIVYKVCHEAPVPATAHNAALPPAVDSVFARALAKDPASRYGTVRQFVEALEGALRGSAWMPQLRQISPMADTETMSPPRAIPFAAPAPRRSGAAWFAAAFALVGLAAVGAALYLFTPDSTTQPPPVVAELKHTAAEPPPPDTAKPEAAAGTEELPAAPTAESPAEVSAAPVATGVTAHDFAIDSTPGGATVEIDNIPAFTCITPCKITLAAGRHTLKATLAGYRPLLRVVDAPSDSSIVMTLDRATGTVMVKSNPPGATILIDGREWPSKTPTMMTLAAGKHALVLRKEGYRDEESSIDVKDGAVMNLDINWLTNP